MTLAHKEEKERNDGDEVDRWSNISGANRRLGNAKSSMLQHILQENNPDAACIYFYIHPYMDYSYFWYVLF